MLKSNITVEHRTELGTNACHRIRNQGNVPGIIYGQHVQPRPIEVDKKELETIIRKFGTNTLLELHVDNQATTAMIKEVQLHPVNDDIIHVDFQEVSFNERIHTTVPIVLKGKGKVESREGIVQQQIRELHIECLPQDIPESIEIDISNIRPNHPMRVSDVEFGAEISILDEPQSIIASLAKTEREITEVPDQDLYEKVMGVETRE
ncbi:MAG: 50S ribosomal protein L25 [Bacillota bacterium]